MCTYHGEGASVCKEKWWIGEGCVEATRRSNKRERPIFNTGNSCLKWGCGLGVVRYLMWKGRCLGLLALFG